MSLLCFENLDLFTFLPFERMNEGYEIIYKNIQCMYNNEPISAFMVYFNKLDITKETF